MSIGFISLMLVLLGIKYRVFWFSLFRSRPFGIRHWLLGMFETITECPE